jgi:23S rRNA pseudouridine1911/1915/1917 synthase
MTVKTTIKKSSTLFEFISGHYPDSPRTRIKKLLHSGAVRVNSRQVTLHSFALKHGDEVEIDHRTGKTTRAGLPFPVLFEDDHIIVIDKPAGISTSSIDGSASVQKIISGYTRDKTKGTVSTFVVHRLDKEVSGVLMFAKSEKINDIIKGTWEETEKHYYALVEGFMQKPEGTIKSWLKEDDKQKMYSTSEKEGGKLAITHYKTIRVTGKYTLLDVNTETGRKNQIRVHLSDIGCPITGDRRYGASADFVRRIRLHAYSLSFPHPVTGKKISVQSPMPDGFLSIKLMDENYKQAYLK